MTAKYLHYMYSTNLPHLKLEDYKNIVRITGCSGLKISKTAYILNPHLQNNTTIHTATSYNLSLLDISVLGALSKKK